MLNNLYQIIVHLNTLTHLLREPLQTEVDFWTGSFYEAFGKLELCMNSDTCLSYFAESIYSLVTPTPPHIGFLDNIFTKKKRKRLPYTYLQENLYYTTTKKLL